MGKFILTTTLLWWVGSGGAGRGWAQGARARAGESLACASREVFERLAPGAIHFFVYALGARCQAAGGGCHMAPQKETENKSVTLPVREGFWHLAREVYHALAMVRVGAGIRP